MRVWSLPVRALHAGLAVSVIGCLVWHEGGRWHEWLGYVALVIAMLRTVMGLTLPRENPASFANFVRGPVVTLTYARAMWRGEEPRHLGHNPLGAWMIVALLACSLAAGASGALYVTDRFWGDESVIAWHAVAGWAFVVLVPLHVAGALLASWRHQENLVASMLHGNKRESDGH